MTNLFNTSRGVLVPVGIGSFDTGGINGQIEAMRSFASSHPRYLQHTDLQIVLWLHREVTNA